jgi:hypothetical protein
MLSCQDISRLYSQSLDRDLPWRQRLSLWMHLRMCRLCGGFARGLRLLREASRTEAAEIYQETAEPVALLTPEARQRIQKAMEAVQS